MMNVVSLGVALLMNKILIPTLGIADAALSSMSYQILQCIWMNIYLKRMGYWPYKKILWVQMFWILLLVGFDYGINFVHAPSLMTKGIIYGIVLLLILGTFYLQGLSEKPSKGTP